jgi:hypothetical protein
VSKKKALIITDGTKTIRSAALHIKESLGGGYKVKICPAKRFIGTDLLAADIFFIGSKKAKPKSFAALDEMLSHINLASRKCGIFSINEKAINYLRGILEAGEADFKEPLLVSEEEIKKSTVNKWINRLL